MPLTYSDCGVSVERNDTWVSQLKYLGVTTGGFASTWEDNDDLWVSSTDGIGSKLILSQETKLPNHLYNLGQDLVAMVVNDIITTGAFPLFLLDYLAVHQIGELNLSELLLGVRESCIEVGCKLLGGETSELPDLIPTGLFDIAGFGVGKIKKYLCWGSQNVKSEDIILGLASSGPHSNGFSLIRKLHKQQPFSQETLVSLLTPTRLYVKVISQLSLDYLFTKVHAAANITGGGLVNNLSRVIPTHLKAKLTSPPLTSIFSIIQQSGNLSEKTLRETFNCGIGFCLIVDKQHVDKIQESLNPLFKSSIIGKITPAS